MEDAAKAALIKELEDAAKWYAVRKISHEGKKSRAYWMAPDEGDPIPPGLSGDAARWIQTHLGRFQALVKRTREEMNIEA